MDQQRRTQSARTAETRRALVDAAIDLLLERGVNGATVTDICRRAGVTTGALQHHFGSKSGLMAKVVRRLFRPFLEDVGPPVPDGAPLRERIGRVVDSYWNIYGSDRYFAVLEVLLATRYDAELMDMVADYRAQQVDFLERTLPAKFADVDMSAAELQRSIHRMADLLRGYSVHRLYERDEAQDREVLANARAMVERDFLPNAKEPRP